MMSVKTSPEKMKIRSLPLEERIRLYNETMSLRKKYGWGYVRIAKKLSIPIDVVRHWLYHGRNPINQGNPNFFKPNPSTELAYLIGVCQGDADLTLRNLGSERSGRIIRLRANDRDFVVKFAFITAKLLGRKKSYKIGFEKNQYRACAYSYYLYEFLKKPLEELKPFIEVYPAEFIRGLTDSDGSAKVSVVMWKKWKWLSVEICVATNTNLELLKYIQDLLRRYFAINSRIKSSHKAGSKCKLINKDGKRITRKKDAYDLIIGGINIIKKFMLQIGFSINRKQQKLVDAIRIIETYEKGGDRVKAWLRLYVKKKNKWIKLS